MKHFLLPLACVFTCISVLSLNAQDAGYQMPPQVLTDMLLAKPTPGVNIDRTGTWMILTETSGYPSVEEIARPELRIAGLRINPENYSRSRQTFINHLYLKRIADGAEFQIKGLPQPLAASSVSWSPDDNKIAFLNTTRERVDLYVVDLKTYSAALMNSKPLNSITSSYQWVDNNTLLYRVTIHPASAAPPKPLTPKGPAVQENVGKASPRPTFQDLIKSPYDEDLFTFYLTTQLIRNTNGKESLVGVPSIYSSVSVSPDQKYLLTETLQKPYSYLVTWSGFSSTVRITDLEGNLVKHLFDQPSTETAPSGKDNIQNIPSGIEWRYDQPATVTWSHPLDSGMIKKEAEYRDAVYALSAPFTGTPTELFKTKMRYWGVQWGNENVALVYEGLDSKDVVRSSTWNPSTGEMKELLQRNTTDAYSNPGSPYTRPNQYNEYVLWTSADGDHILYNNTTGSSPKGDRPFVMRYQLSTGKADTIWKCGDGDFEMVTRILDPEALTMVSRRENKTVVPNFWLKDLKKRIADRPLTTFANPYPQMDGVTKEKIRYQRADGVNLTGELYLPAGYDKEKDGPLPVYIWAYPAEYQSASDAAQVRGSESKFTWMNWGTPVFYVTQGYAVLNNAEMPIVSTDPDQKPNDDFINQLKMNARAAIDKLAEMGVGDSTRVAVGGHSYGAFMTANLLAHTNWFKAGIARSGAYNRTLTPFGFQNEDRTYWEAPEIYHEMSPFSNAHKIKTPLLIVHGEADNNPGTFPIQSERLFNAIKGHGGTVRYVSLPHESHGYQGRENLLHLLSEQLNWMERYVKGVEMPKKNGKS